jgi:hypothetical protein
MPRSKPSVKCIADDGAPGGHALEECPAILRYDRTGTSEYSGATRSSNSR